MNETNKLSRPTKKNQIGSDLTKLILCFEKIALIKESQFCSKINMEISLPK